MCISPVSIPNPNYGLFRDNVFSKYIDTESAYIKVNCGHCSECIHSHQLDIVQRLQMESLDNYLFFATLTYKPSMLPKITTSTGYSLPFADWRDLQLCFKRLNNRKAFTRPFRYLAVSERGSEKGRPHFHVIFILPKYKYDHPFTPVNLEKVMFDSLLKEWRRKVGGSKRKPIYEPLCLYRRKYIHGVLHYNYDLHYVVPSLDDDGSDVAFYVTKYLLKPSEKEARLQQALRLNLSPDEYEDTWSIVRSRIDSSLYLGFGQSSGTPTKKVADYLRRSVSISKDFPQFFNSKGNSFPLSRYYKKVPEVFTLDDALRLNVHKDRIRSYSELIRLSDDYQTKLQKVADRGMLDNYLSVFDDE